MQKLSCDFETTTDEKDCRVWAWAACEVENVDHFYCGNSIDGFFNFIQLNPYELYFHNLKFDGNFIISYLFRNGYSYNPDRRKLDTHEFNTLITDKGQFYTIEIMLNKSEKGKHDQKVIIHDSMKIIPLSVDKMAKAFNLPITKLSIDYKEKREIGHVLTEKEKAYIHNDVTIVALALQYFFKQGLNKITIGSNALNNYKEIIGKKAFEKYFPPPAYDHDIRLAYKGGFTYVASRFQGPNNWTRLSA